MALPGCRRSASTAWWCRGRATSTTCAGSSARSIRCCNKPGCDSGRCPPALEYALLRLRVAGAYQMTGHCAGVRALLEDRRAGDQRRLVSLDPLDEAAAACRHVMDELRLVQS